MKKIRMFVLSFSIVMALLFTTNILSAFAFEPNWIYGTYVASINGKIYDLDIGWESYTGNDYISITDGINREYHSFYTNDNVSWYGIDSNLIFVYNGIDIVTLHDGVIEIPFVKTEDLIASGVS